MIMILPAEKAHIPSIAALEQQCFPDPWSEKLLLDALEHEYNHVWCAVSDGTVCGYIVLSRTGEEMNVDILAVAPNFRGQGIAKQLLEEMHSRYPTTFFLEVRASNDAAIGLYQSMGYVQVGLRMGYYQNPKEDALLFTRNNGFLSAV